MRTTNVGRGRRRGCEAAHISGTLLERDAESGSAGTARPQPGSALASLPGGPDMATSPSSGLPAAARRIYCNRTLNLRSIHAVGYDMDYTLVHYRVETWEEQAYERLQDLLAGDGFPVAGLAFDPTLSMRGLVIDTRARQPGQGQPLRLRDPRLPRHPPLEFEEQREVYRHTPIDLAEQRFVFLNTLFSLSASCLYAQLVDLHDRGPFPGVLGYADLYRRVAARLDEAHIEGRLKAEIVADPGPLRGPRPRRSARAPRPAASRQAADAHHQRRVALRAGDHGLRLRPLPAEGADLARPVRAGDRRRPQARLLQSQAPPVPGRGRGRPAPAGPRADPRARPVPRRRRGAGGELPPDVGRGDPLRRRPHLRRRQDVQEPAALAHRAGPARARGRGRPRSRRSDPEKRFWLP